ncbi:50S ribosomal protein L32 [Candidatus Peregrinibacteria bacterium]|nr:50S ribosomal protein L32 [Candidatus Peregrinibacteria bacterium]
MAKHPVPKKKQPKSHTKKRYGSFQTKVLKKLSNAVNLVNCPNCGAKSMSHTVCHECGQYRGRQVVDKQKQIDKITKIKA